MEGFAFALLDAPLVKEEPNGSLASAGGGTSKGLILCYVCFIT